MPRDASGNYTLPLPDVVGGDPILADGWANPTLQDLANEMTDSLSRSGKGGFTGPILAIGGSVSAPGYSWSAEPSTGMYRAASGDMRVAVAGVDRGRWTSGGLQDRRDSTWQRVASGKHFSATAESIGNVVVGSPATTDIFAGGSIAARANANGLDLRRSGATGNTVLAFQDELAAEQFTLLWNDAASQFQLRGKIPGGDFGVVARNGGDTEDRTLLFANPDGASSFYYAGGVAVSTTLRGGSFFSQDDFGQLSVADALGNTASIYKINGSYAELRNGQDGENVRLTARDSISTIQTLFQGDPDGQAQMYYQGVSVLKTFDDGAGLYGATDATLRFFGDNFTTQTGFITNPVASLFEIGNSVNGVGMLLSARNNVGTKHTLWTADPDGESSMYYAGAVRVAAKLGTVEIGDGITGNFALDILGGSSGDAGGQMWLRGSETNPDAALDNNAGQFRLFVDGASEVAMSATPNGSVNLAYAGSSKLRTALETTADVGMGAEVIDGLANWRPVGMNVMPPIDDGATGSPFKVERNGNLLRHNSATPHTWNVLNDPNIPVGATWPIINGGTTAGGTITLDAAVGVTIYVVRGSTIEASSSGGTVELLGGCVATMYKFSDTAYYVWGNGVGNVT